MRETEAAFDQYAVAYDEEFTFSSVGKLQRERVWKFISENISSQSHPEVLELNCGTGEDAVWFVKNGFQITATDLSNEMVLVARQKVDSNNAAFLQSGISEIGSKLNTQKFNLIFSDFGGLNCLDSKSLMEMSKVFSGMLKPGGRMIFVVMSRNCKWEQWYFKRKHDMKNAFRRRSPDAVEAVIFDKHFSTWYYSPAEISSFFETHFNTKKHQPIGIALPPSYLDNYFKRHPLLLKMLNVLEKTLSHFSFLSDHADHFIIDFEKQ
ncbi:MAG: class I SAM-dependent methyltransferase [Bacteroidia bacterium]